MLMELKKNSTAAGKALHAVRRHGATSSNKDSPD